ncbi:hypothetical protein C9374_014679 [Naegleria lovaniensis]|uniref:Uncharacterized protein n=1 Tax=Naegleria lovaniensis TaxID=51637 RepID=A0AA88GCZ4_NAELO|nr:uncharacterized protein C9374_014679 [Naegleria lovaniensis]KAG2370685.1 hypothetical protein C9374_014679 [Naegleria lovaniensis]
MMQATRKNFESEELLDDELSSSSHTTSSEIHFNEPNLDSSSNRIITSSLLVNHHHSDDTNNFNNNIANSKHGEINQIINANINLNHSVSFRMDLPSHHNSSSNQEGIQFDETSNTNNTLKQQALKQQEAYGKVTSGSSDEPTNNKKNQPSSSLQQQQPIYWIPMHKPSLLEEPNQQLQNIISPSLEDDSFLMIDVNERGDLYTSQTFLDSNGVRHDEEIRKHRLYPSMIPSGEGFAGSLPKYSVCLDLDQVAKEMGSDIQVDVSSFVNAPNSTATTPNVMDSSNNIKDQNHEVNAMTMYPLLISAVDSDSLFGNAIGSQLVKRSGGDASSSGSNLGQALAASASTTTTTIMATSVDLIPLLQPQIELGYLNNLLLNESAVLDRMGKRQIEFHHDFYVLCYEYYNSFCKVKKLKDSLAQLVSEQKGLQKSLFTFSTKTFQSPTCQCGDGYQLVGSVTALNATPNKHVIEALHKNFAQIRRLYHDNVVEANLLNKYANIRISHYLDELISSSNLFNVQTPIVLTLQHNTRSEHDNEVVERLKTCIQILFFFEQVTHGMASIVTPLGCTELEFSLDETMKELKSFRNDIRNWISWCVTQLIKIATIEDNRFIIFEIVKCDMWVLGLHLCSNFQFIDSDSSVDQFLAFFSLFLTPTYIKENELILTEDDYLSLWQQLRLFESMDYILSGCTQQFFKEKQSSYFTSLSRAFSFIDTVLYILYQALINFSKSPSHSSFTRMLSQNMARLVQMASNSISQLEGVSTEDIEYLFNSFYVKCFKGLLSSTSNLWSFLSELPYEIISEACACSIFWIMFRDEKTVDMNISYDVLRDLDLWTHKLNENKTLRNNFITMFQQKECGYLFPVLSRLGCSHSFGLASIIVHELFLIGCKLSIVVS